MFRSAEKDLLQAQRISPCLDLPSKNQWDHLALPKFKRLLPIFPIYKSTFKPYTWACQNALKNAAAAAELGQNFWNLPQAPKNSAGNFTAPLCFAPGRGAKTPNQRLNKGCLNDFSICITGWSPKPPSTLTQQKKRSKALCSTLLKIIYL